MQGFARPREIRGTRGRPKYKLLVWLPRERARAAKLEHVITPCNAGKKLPPRATSSALLPKCRATVRLASLHRRDTGCHPRLGSGPQLVGGVAARSTCSPASSLLEAPLLPAPPRLAPKRHQQHRHSSLRQPCCLIQRNLRRSHPSRTASSVDLRPQRSVSNIRQPYCSEYQQATREQL